MQQQLQTHEHVVGFAMLFFCISFSKSEAHKDTFNEAIRFTYTLHFKFSTFQIIFFYVQKYQYIEKRTLYFVHNLRNNTKKYTIFMQKPFHLLINCWKKYFAGSFSNNAEPNSNLKTYNSDNADYEVEFYYNVCGAGTSYYFDSFFEPFTFNGCASDNTIS